MNRFFKHPYGRLAPKIRWLCILGIISSSSAGAECTLQTSANIPTYSALADTIGMLNVNVICDQADGPYTLELTSPPSQLVPGSLNGTLSLQLLTDSQTPLKLLLINAAKSLAGENGLVYRGNQQLQFAVLIPGNQWTVQGNLSENLKFQLLTSNDKR